MNRIKIEKMIRENIIAIILSLVVVFLSVQTKLPLLNILSTTGLFFLGVPWVVVGERNGIWASVLGMGILTGLSSFLFSPWTALLGIVLFGPLVIVIQIMIDNKRRVSEIFIAASLIFFVSIVTLGIISSQMRGVDIRNDISSAFQDNKAQVMSALEEQDINELDMSSLEARIDIFYKNMMAIMPTVMILISAMIGYFNYKMSAWILNNMGYRKIEVPDFSRFVLPRDIALGIIMSYILIYILRSKNIDYHAGLSLNINGLFSVMFLVQGMSLLSYYLKRMRIGKVLRVIFIAFMMRFGIVGTLMLFAGMFDTIFDFRKIRKTSL